MLSLTSATAALAAVTLIVLSVRVSLRRKAVGVKIGSSDDLILMRRVRAQGNFVEYVPLALILLGLAEHRQAPMAVLWAMAGLLVVGRGLHVAGLLTNRTVLSAPGMVGTYGALLVGAGALLFG